jgi:hypothetical protein
MTKYTHNQNDPWSWTRAKPEDINSILTLCDRNFKSEADTIFTTSWPVMNRRVSLAIVNQSFAPEQEILCVARRDKQVLAYFWAIRNHYMEYSQDEMSEIRYIHSDLSLSLRNRVRLTAQSLEIWESWCGVNGIAVLASSTMRDSQRGFLRLHEQMGYTVRGSCCYKRTINK